MMLISQEKYGIFGYDPESGRKQEEQKRKQKHERMIWICTLAFLLLGMTAFFLQAWITVSDQPVLALSDDSIVLKKGEPFEPMHYVREYTNAKGVLILPEGIDTDTAGTKAAVYRLRFQERELTRTMLIRVEEKDGSQ